MSVRFPHLFLWVLATLVFSAGCQRRPLDAKIHARSDLAFSLWISEHGSELTADDARDLNDAVKQIKLSVMTEFPGLAAKEFSDQVYLQINGITARAVLLRSLEIQSDRINAEIKALETRDGRYQQIDQTGLSQPKRDFLDGFNARMAQRRADLQQLDDRKTLLLAR